MHQEEVVRFWYLNKEDSPTEMKIDLETAATCALAAEPLVLQTGRISNQDSDSEAQPSFVFKRDSSAHNQPQVVPL
jgi:hypothetical protein